jgi:hypothetical protein
MIVVTKKPNKKALLVEIENKLSELQRIVGGHIEIVQLTQKIVVICDDEGKLKGYEPNLKYGLDTLVGTVIFAGVEGEEIKSLNDEQLVLVANFCEAFEV